MIAVANDALTFGLSLAAFALLALDASRRWHRRRSALLTRLVFAVAAAHIVCVWAFRFGWSAAEMWQKSAFAFLLFHGAAVVLGVANVVREPRRTVCVLAAFAIVCAGALPAPFRYPEIAWLRAPVVAILVAAVAVMMLPRRSTEPAA